MNLSILRRTALALALTALCTTGCSEESSNDADVTMDATDGSVTPDTSEPDTSDTTVPDATPDTADTSPDTAVPDATPDTTTDTKMDATPDVTPDTTDADTTEPCCIEAECEATGQVCDQTACTCVEPPQCSELGAACDPNKPDGIYACVDFGDESTCQEACITSGDCTDPTALCLLANEGDAVGYCQGDQCDTFFNPDCDDATDKCVPANADVDLCLPSGTGTEGDACETSDDCDQSHLCSAGGTCIVVNCAPSGQPACPTGQSCNGFGSLENPIDIGQCVTNCVAFDDTDMSCGTDEWCFPVEAGVDGFDGQCVESDGGTKVASEVCDDDNPCADGLACLSGTCKELCDPAAANDTTGGCSGADKCLPVGDGDIGICTLDCTVYETGTCADTEWCAPDFEGKDSGYCIGDNGDAQAGDLCDDTTAATTCDVNNVCLGEGACRTFCDPDAAGTDNGVCAEGACAQLGDGAGGTLPVGVCLPDCEYGVDTTCNDTVRDTCGILDNCISLPTVLNTGDDCVAAGIGEFGFCAPGALCLDLEGLGNSLLCEDLCLPQEGGDADCRAPNATCIPLEDPTLGICVVPAP